MTTSSLSGWLRLPLLFLLGGLCCIVGAAAPPRMPVLFLWGWERPEDFRFLAGRADTGIAPVVATVWLEGERAIVHLRRNPLIVPPGTALLPVVHVDASVSNRPALSALQQHTLVDAVLGAAPARGSSIQIDFEARPSQRAFYRGVIAEVRKARPDLNLSVTALASWCQGDPWLGQTQVDEVVPMLFRMGRDGDLIRRKVAASGGLAQPHCNSLGISTDEPLAVLPRHARLFVFSPRSWSDRDYRDLLTELQP